jgi:hypothetical protein
VGAAVIPAGHKCRFCGSDFLKGLPSIAETFDLSGISPWTDDDKIIEHDAPAVDAMPVSDELLLAGRIVHQKCVCISPLPEIQGLASPHCDNANLCSSLSFEQRQNVSKEARLFS